MGKYTYYYFNGRGRGETVRLIFAASGTSFEDKRIEFEDWPAFKPKTPTGTLPVLEVSGQAIPQSLAIARYVARKTGLAGKNDLDQAQVDAIADTITELREQFVTAAFTKDDAKKAELITAFKEKLPDPLKLFEAKLSKGQKYLHGKSLTWADLHFFSLMEGIAQAVPDALNDFPALQGLMQRIQELPKIAKYLKNRPETPL